MLVLLHCYCSLASLCVCIRSLHACMINLDCTLLACNSNTILLLLVLLLQVILCGDSGVGKTCLIERMFSNRFDPTLPSTIGKAHNAHTRMQQHSYAVRVVPAPANFGDAACAGMCMHALSCICIIVQSTTHACWILCAVLQQDNCNLCVFCCCCCCCCRH
jgi:hypothetical protein